MILSRDPSLSASRTTLSRTALLNPVRGDHGEPTVMSPSTMRALWKRTHDPHPGSVSAGPALGVSGHSSR